LGITSTTSSARDEWRSGWRLVLASFSGVTLTALMAYSMGLFVEPLEREFGWSRTLISSGLTIYAFVSVILTGFVGILVDRFGPRKIALLSVPSFCAAYALIGTTSGSPFHWWALWVLVTLAAVFTTPLVWNAAVVSRFDKMRGLALSLALCGTALTAVVAPLIGGYLLARFGWRGTFFGIGAIWFAFSMPLVIAFFYSATDLERGSPAIAKKPAPDGADFREALRSAMFYKIAIASFLVMLVVTGCIVHFIPALRERGIDNATALTVASAIGFATFIGRLMTGALLDRAPAHLVGAAAFALPAVVCAVMSGLHGSLPLAFLAAVLLGLSAGAEMEVASYLSSRYFGMKNFGTLFGIIMGLISFASGLGPTFTALAFDSTGSYDIAFWIGIPLALLAGGLIVSLGSSRRY
jgi:MFS family permease